MKKFKAFALCAATLACAGTIAVTTSCGNGGTKFGFIFLHDDNSTYDKNFIEAAKTACENKGVKALLQVNVAEDENCYSTAKDLVSKGCKGIFADSFGHEAFLLQAAKEYKNVQFAHATGTLAHTEKLDNYHNAFANIYEGRYIAGVAAGMKINQMIENGLDPNDAIMGYVGAFPYAEVVSGYTSFYLGAKSVCPSVTMKVKYTNSWYDETAEANVATTLIDDEHCVLISQHADSQGAPNVCERKGKPNVFYNGENANLKNSYLTASKINWVPFFEYFIENTLNGNTMDYDWCGSLSNGSVQYLGVNETIAAPGTKAKMDETAEKIKNGEIKVFDTNTFTVSTLDIVKGQALYNVSANIERDTNNHITKYKADVDTDANYQGDTFVVDNGVFQESKFRSAPYFDLRIDGITEI